MAIVFRSATTASINNSQSVTVSRPTGLTQDDVLVATLMVDGTDVDTPAGWTKVNQTAGTYELATFIKVAGASEPTSYAFTAVSGSGDFAVALAAYVGVDTVDPIMAQASSDSGLSSTAGTAPAVTAGDETLVITAWGIGQSSGTYQAVADATTNQRAATSVAGLVSVGVTLADFVSPAGNTGSKTASTASKVFWATQTLALRVGNAPPSAPTLLGPADGATLDRNMTQRFSWQFNDPNPGDTQSAYEIRYRRTV